MGIERSRSDRSLLGRTLQQNAELYQDPRLGVIVKRR